MNQAITDEELLDMALRGDLRFRPGTNPADDLVVEKWHGSRRRHEALSVQSHPRTGRACYMVRLGTDGRGKKARQRKVYRNKLVFMLTHRRLVTPGCNVDHADLDRTNDDPGNLREHGRRESDRQGYDVQRDKNLAECSRFFDWVGAGFDAEAFR